MYLEYECSVVAVVHVDVDCGYCVRVCDGGGGDGYTDVEKR